MENNTLYHYCSLDSFLAITKGKTLRLSDVTKSNDSEEIKYLWDCYIAYIQENSQTATVIKEPQLFWNRQMENTHFLTFSLSEEKDFLPLWQSYARGGVSIGFDIDLLRNWVKRFCEVENCIALYDQDEFEETNSQGMAQFNKMQYYSRTQAKKAIAELFNGVNFERMDIDGILSSIIEVFKKTPFIKTNFWDGENEWRISMPLLCQEQRIDPAIVNDPRIKKPKKGEMEYARKGAHPLCISCLVPFDPKMMVSVKLSSDCAVKEADVRQLLIECGFNHIVENNNISRSDGTLQ